ncbi:MAG: dihydroxyacetone kinase subunit DhaK, partial [Solirubrobacteraceae bacterium]
MKKFVNDPQQFVPEMLRGIELANPGKLKYVPEYNLIMRTDAPRDDKVSIVQGSGSGHEPAHVMVVGKGMLDAACPGDVFSAPPSDYVYETTKLMASEKGVLHIINNYTGDRMAFDMGRELAEAEDI